MKQLISLILFFGLAINVSGQDQPTNREEAMAKVSWLIGDWERTGSNGNTQQVSYEWATENVAISITTDGGSTAASRIMQLSGVLGFDIKSGKLVGKSFIRRGHIDTEWSFADGKLIEKSTINVTFQGEVREFKFARSYRSVDKNTLERTMHSLNDAGEVGEVVERNGAKMISKWNRKKSE
jgi:hypothetical protein